MYAPFTYERLLGRAIKGVSQLKIIPAVVNAKLATLE